jgi:hypothetical protein
MKEDQAMKAKQTMKMTLLTVALGFGLIGAGYAASQRGTQDPVYTSGIQMKDQAARNGASDMFHALLRL